MKIHCHLGIMFVTFPFLYCVTLIIYFPLGLLFTVYICFQSLNGVWVNGTRIHPEVAHKLKHGDSIQLGVPLQGAEVEYDYVLVKRPLKDIKGCLAKENCEVAKTPVNELKRKLEEVEPSTSKPKLYRCSSEDLKCLATPCPLPLVNKPTRPSQVQPAETIVRGHDTGEEPPSESASKLLQP